MGVVHAAGAPAQRLATIRAPGFLMPSQSKVLSLLLSLFAASCALFGAPAPDVVLTKTAVVYYRRTEPSLSPATIEAARVMVATPEWQRMQGADALRRVEAQRAVNERIAAACRKVAAARGLDLVVRAGDIVDARGRAVIDVTAAVIAEL